MHQLSDGVRIVRLCLNIAACFAFPMNDKCRFALNRFIFIHVKIYFGLFMTIFSFA